jgi:hypothetical protein
MANVMMTQQVISYHFNVSQRKLCLVYYICDILLNFSLLVHKLSSVAEASKVTEETASILKKTTLKKEGTSSFGIVVSYWLPIYMMSHPYDRDFKRYWCEI